MAAAFRFVRLSSAVTVHSKLPFLKPTASSPDRSRTCRPKNSALPVAKILANSQAWRQISSFCPPALPSIDRMVLSWGKIFLAFTANVAIFDTLRA